MSSPNDIAARFNLKGRPCHVGPLGSGNINRTFLLCTDAGEKAVLQELNPAVFKSPSQIMENLSRVLRHMKAELKRQGLAGGAWRLPEIIRTRDNLDYDTASDGSCWRALEYVDNADTMETVRTVQQAKNAGMALGRFHRLTHNLNPNQLHDTLPGFHETHRYLAHYDEVIRHSTLPSFPPKSRNPLPRSSSPTRHSNESWNPLPPSRENAEYCTEIIEKYRALVSVLEEARQTGRIQTRTMHGDPKVSNILFDSASGEAIALVDLDTVKPGLVLYDIGDFFRSACNPAGEETETPDNARFDLHLFEHSLQGYLQEMKGLINPGDKKLIYEAIRTITLELGIRFFTDYLEGNVYFNTSFETQNLNRAAVQLKLLENISSQEKEIQDIIIETNSMSLT